MYGGGGHLFAAGGKLKSLDQLDSLIKDLDDLQPVPSDSLD
jgi:nanoRNase/pAp phosphatase (c-di-AMP/oligoRNAs hydrolase)